jgi:hypothetical protein
MRSTAVVCTLSYTAPAFSVVRRTVAAETVTPVKKANISAAWAKGIHAPKRTTLSRSRGVSCPGSNPNGGKNPT